MVEMHDEESNEVLEMEKIIEKLLMPPPSMTPKTFVRTSVESLRDASGSSLDRSNDSSGGTNNSWLSDSSCGCHSISPRTDVNKKSAFVFHKQSLLPPLLCSASRTEMQIYRTRAVEREEKRKLRSKQRLISRVEAILSSVDMRKKDLNDNNPEINSSGEKLPCHFPNEEEKMRSKEEKSLGDESDDFDNRHGDGFHDSAYRSSLRNLLQKSLILNKTSAMETSEVKEASTSSESETDVTENTVVETQEKTTIQEQPEAQRNTGSGNEHFNEEEKAVNYLVENVIKEAKTRIMNETKKDDDVKSEQEMEQKYSVLDMKRESNHTEDESLWRTPVIIKDGKDIEEISPLGVAIVHGNDLHNQSTSTKVNFILGEDAMMKDDRMMEEGNLAEQSPITLNETAQRIDKSLDVTELKGSLCYDSTIADSCSVPMGTNSPESTMVPLATDSTIGDMTILRPITSATASNITITNLSQKSDETLDSCPKFENEFCKDLAMETGSLITLKRSSSFTLDCPSISFESAVIQAVSRHFHGIRTEENSEQTKQDNDAMFEHELSAVDMKKKMMLSARVRRGSYTLEEPSPYLIKNKNDHMISDDCSETTDGSVIDVKRRLDLPSDSEESSVAMSAKKSINNVSEEGERQKIGMSKEPAVTDVYRLLNTEHQQQMKILKKQHEKQIQNLQQELIRDKVMPMPKKCGNFKSYSLDYTVSPSRASTEYHDIDQRGRQYEEEDEDEDEDVSTPVDVSRITETEITSTLHQKLCKLSALCKGNLTRRLLRTSKVQDIMKIIRDTSRLILSLRTEPKQSIDGIISVRDTMFEDQLITQLRSAMYQLHDIFFTISKSEQMYVIAMSRDDSRSKKSTKQCQLSMATKKSLERKRLLSSSTEPPSRPNSNVGKACHPKEVKSKISHIWKSPEQKSSTSNHNPKVISQKPVVTSQKPAPTTSQNSKGNSTNFTARQVLQRPKVKPSKSKVTSQESRMTPSNAKMTSQNVRKRAVKKSMPLSNKINHGNQSISKA